MEIFLRVAGFAYRSYRINNKFSVSEKGNDIKILCLGDSYTFGVGAAKGFSYPEQLEKMLNEGSANSKFIVINGGIPGYNSSQLSNHFEEFVQRYNPDFVVVMIGVNNSTLPLESNYILFKNRGFKTQLYKIDYFLSKLRSYKMMKFFIGKLQKVTQSKENKIKSDILIPERVDNEEFARLIDLGNRYLGSGEVQLARNSFQEAIELRPDDERGYIGLASALIAYPPNQYELAIEKLDKALKINPNNLEALDLLWMAYYRLGRNEKAQEVIEKYVSLHPQDEMNLSYFLNKGLPDINDEEVFYKVLRFDLENIVKLAKKLNLKIILQGYPSFKFKVVNKITEEVADRFNVLFVNNESVFKRLVSRSEYGWEDPTYFAEDGHCNANGYRIVAENLCKVIRAGEGF